MRPSLLGKIRLTLRNQRNKKYSIDLWLFEKQSSTQYRNGGEFCCTDWQCDTSEPLTNDFQQRQYPPLSEVLGKLKVELHLRIEATLQAKKIPTRKVPISLQTDLKNELGRLSETWSHYASINSNWLNIIHDCGKEVERGNLIVHWSKVIECSTQRNQYPTPTIKDILPDLSKPRVFSVVDAKDGFLHIQLDPYQASRFLITFETPPGTLSMVIYALWYIAISIRISKKIWWSFLRFGRNQSHSWWYSSVWLWKYR